MKTRALWMTAALGLGLLGATVLQALNARGMAPPPVVPPAAPARHVAAEGRVVAYPGAEVLVSAERGGRLVRLAVEERQRVRRGDLLAELDGSELDAALREARARRETARAEAARIEAQLAKTRIVAPISGTVIARPVDAGETVEAGEAIVTLADLTRLRIEGEADEADAAALVEGAAVRIRADGHPDEEWRGRVEEIADAVTLRRLKPQDPSRPTDTRILAVKVAFAETTPLRLGTTVELRIEAAKR